MERTNLINDLKEFVNKAQQLDATTDLLNDCIQELKGILLKHLEQSGGKAYENLR